MADYTDLEDLKGDDTIDSQDLIAALESYDEAIEEDNDTYSDEEKAEIKKTYGELAEEVRQLDGCVPDWVYGATMIHEDHFTEYAQDFADGIGAYDHDAPWPLNHIDWEAAANELRNDYTTISYAGHDYLVR